MSFWFPSPCQNLTRLSMCFAVVLITILPRSNVVAGGTTTGPSLAGTTIISDAGKPPGKTPESVHLLDLSYLHRCGVKNIANAIRGTLEQQQQEQLTTDMAEPVVDIDLTASLIGKNVSEILASMAKASEKALSDDASRSPSSVQVRLKARRNKLSPEEITSVLEFVLQNGPTNETIAATTIIEGEGEGEDIHENENKTATTSGEEDRESSQEKATTLVAEEIETDDNSTAVASGTTENVSAEPSNADGDSNDTDTKINDGGDEPVDIETESAATTETVVTTPVTTTRTRPAFVSIRSLDLGWNNLGSSNPRRSAGARTVNRALRQLLANPERCPPTIVLEMCGLKPRDCRDLGRGIVERYQSRSEEGAAELPQPLSLNLACNEEIGDVGVAALAAAIRTAVIDSGSGNKEETRNKKRRRKKKKRSKKQTLREDETEQMKTEVEEDEDDKIEQEVTEDIQNANSNEDREPSTEEQSGALAAEAKATTRTILERLDLSGCGIGDVGAEALAIALTDSPLCVRHLDLSNNKITDQGAIALASALGKPTEEDNTPSPAGLVETLDLSHNKDLGDRGAKELAQAFQRDGISNLVLRSCNVRADGAACFGSALRSFGLRVSSSSSSPSPSVNGAVGKGPEKRSIDLSGNPLGILSKKKKSGSKYSATALRSKATDTTKAYMNIIGKSLQKGLNSISGEIGGGQQDTLESDDEEEDRMGNANKDEDDTQKKCGALSLAEAFLRHSDRDTGSADTAQEASVHVELGLRFCSFDTRAAEALAAVLQESNQNYSGMKLALDLAMNDVLEESTLAALHGEEAHSHRLEDMAEVYLDALAVVREARKRALQASQMGAARARARAEREMAWGDPYAGPRQGGGEGAWSGTDDDEIDDGLDDDSEDSIPDEYDRKMHEYYSDDDDDY